MGWISHASDRLAGLAIGAAAATLIALVPQLLMGVPGS
jgi:tetrahydromethanopterin S-methyltransferase subunit F